MRLLTLLLLFLCPLAHAATVMGTYGVSTTGYVSATQLITNQVSLTAGVTTWGYIGSGASYIPNLATNIISASTINIGGIPISIPTSATTSTMKPNFPDAIMCLEANGSTYVLYLSLLATNTVQYTYPRNTGTVVSFDGSGTYVSSGGLGTSDCATGTWSISQFYANNRAFNFIGGNNLLSLDRITSGTTAAIIATAAGTISLTTGSVSGTAYFDTLGRLVNAGVSTTGPISTTALYSTGQISTSSLYASGAITIPNAPTATTDAANKAYVDSVASAAGGTSVACSNMGSAACTLTRLGTTALAQKTLYSVAVSSDGTKMAVASYGDYIYTSNDSGTTWTQRTNSGVKNWIKVTISDNGTILYATTADTSGTNRGIWKSTDSGATWAQLTSYGSSTYTVGTNISVSADGSALIINAGASGSYSAVYSINGGSSWTSITAGSYGYTVSMSPNGMNMLYMYYNGTNYPLYRMLNRATGVNVSSYNYQQPIQIMDDGGYYLINISSPNTSFYRSYASGNNKTLYTTASGISYFAVSANGSKIMLANSSNNQISTDGGDTFNTATLMNGIGTSSAPVIDTNGKIYFVRASYDSPVYVLNCP